MPELLSPQQAQQTLVALPGPAAKAVPQGGQQAQPPAAAPSPFRPMAGAGPRVLLLPHEDQPSTPARQVDDRDVVRLGREIGPVRLAHPDDYHAFHRSILSNVNDEGAKKVYADFLDEEGHPHMAHAMREGSGLDADRWLRHAREVFVGNSAGQMSPWQEVAAGQFRHRADPNLAVYLNLHRHRTTGDMAAGIEPAIGTGNFYPSQLNGGLATNDMDYVRGMLGELTGPWNHLSDRDWDKLQEWAKTSGPQRTPERFAAQAPPGGLIVRGLMVKGGQFAPKEAVESHPAPTGATPRKPPARDRLRAALRGRRRTP